MIIKIGNTRNNGWHYYDCDSFTVSHKALKEVRQWLDGDSTVLILHTADIEVNMNTKIKEIFCIKNNSIVTRVYTDNINTVYVLNGEGQTIDKL